MDINQSINNLVNYAESNPVIAAVIAVVMLYLLIKKPKVLFGLISISILFVVVMKIIRRLFESGSF